MSGTARQTLMLLLILCAAAASADPGEPAAETEKGKPALESAGQLAFGPDHVLFVADSIGAAR